MSEEYMQKLMQQYIQAYDLYLIERTSSEFLNGFVSYLQEMKLIGKEYYKLLENMGCDVDISSTAELNKGVHDSIAKKNTTIISPYAGTMQRDNCELIITDGSVSTTSNRINVESINTFITQNPLTSADINLIERIISLGKYKVFIALYGKNTEKDIEEKILNLKYLKDIYHDSLREVNQKTDNQYLYMLMSK